jgi:CheY-like chemotaxis protein
MAKYLGVITASNGREALGRLKTDDRIDILMTDINMPGLGGFELAEIVRRLRPEADGHGMPLIRKPFGPTDVTRVMSQTKGLW